ncbi:FAD-binding oxidoreductase [Mesobaculum littorinae]|uniref:FAD-binding oxidoreductase n=1 Tax=Mesobaculum littorinae TaxID=2486419 RepID=A0A438ADB2_9RHOB|nr:FAD-binding oxidoreductase [Mesobaculum littorinae]RVV96674.1 FAD-binding oxidoreductase [Mesobaculum littorinae]
MGSLTRRALLFASGAAVGVLGVRVVAPALPTRTGTRSLQRPEVEGILNDASGLSPTPVRSARVIDAEADERLANLLRNTMDEAAETGAPVCIGAARQSMGGHALPRAGHAVRFDNGFVEPHTSRGTYRVHAGARWHQVIGALDPLGFSPAVMQAGRDFGVAAAFCVNAHGGDVPATPVGATVRSLRMITASGDWVTCSRDDAPELFAMTMGGYGLTGLITDLELEMVPNRRLTPVRRTLPVAEAGEVFARIAADPQVVQAVGWLSVSPSAAFRQVQVTAFEATDNQSELPPVSAPGRVGALARRTLTAQTGRAAAKRLRWWAQTEAAPLVRPSDVTRNTLLNCPAGPVRWGRGRTGIQQEYFLPPPRLAEFLASCAEIVPASYQELLKATLRHVGADRESWLSYAPDGPRLGVALTFSQEMTTRAEADMTRLTRDLIDRALDLGGSYYLPYRPHATSAQFRRAYPRAAEFAAAKRRLDPDLRFRNGFWDTYLATL